MRRQKVTLYVSLVGFGLCAITGCGSRGLAKTELLVELPDYCNTPDAMAMFADGSFLLSVPNYNDISVPAEIMKVSADNKVTRFFTPPAHPDSGRAGPMGICLAPSGDVYYADNQFGDNSHEKSRVMRIEIKNGKPIQAQVVASGLNVANAVVIRNGYLYISDSVMVPGSEPLVSGVLRFRIGEEGITLKSPVREDPHLIATIESHNIDIGYGADGLCFDPSGNLYIGNFSDGTIHKLQFDNQGNVISNSIWVNDPKMKCADGLFYDKGTNAIYVADMIQNAIQVVTLDGKVKTLARNGDTDGIGGSLDQPCEAIVRDNEVIVSNMDWPFPGIVNTTFDKPYTLSVIPLEE
ncbi:MAG: hypothetical protein JXA82_13920 [Sedimentisphaerales bacterium]|nr:hypothetical protein [Sedimentisphaerales bacterium]